MPIIIIIIIIMGLLKQEKLPRLKDKDKDKVQDKMEAAKYKSIQDKTCLCQKVSWDWGRGLTSEPKHAAKTTVKAQTSI